MQGFKFLILGSFMSSSIYEGERDILWTEWESMTEMASSWAWTLSRVDAVSVGESFMYNK